MTPLEELISLSFEHEYNATDENEIHTESMTVVPLADALAIVQKILEEKEKEICKVKDEIIQEQNTRKPIDDIVEQIEKLREPEANNKWTSTVVKVWNRAIEMCKRIVEGGE